MHHVEHKNRLSSFTLEHTSNVIVNLKTNKLNKLSNFAINKHTKVSQEAQRKGLLDVKQIDKSKQSILGMNCQ